MSPGSDSRCHDRGDPRSRSKLVRPQGGPRQTYHITVLDACVPILNIDMGGVAPDGGHRKPIGVHLGCVGWEWGGGEGGRVG